MQNKRGFTLVESLVSLFIVSSLLVLTIPLKRHSIFERIELLKLKSLIDITHRENIETQKEKKIAFDGNTVWFDSNRMNLQHCTIESNEFKFLKNGNVNKSFSANINCSVNNYSLIIHLGSGHVAIK